MSDQRSKRDTMSIEEATISNMWEIATALLEETTITSQRARSIVRAAFQRSLGSEKDKRMMKAEKPQQEKSVAVSTGAAGRDH
jgi:hypothetical protein